jgi:hypothetical protein
MNIATLGILAIMLMAFKPKNGKVPAREIPVDPEGNAISPQPEEQITQGYYTPRASGYIKKKMNTPAILDPPFQEVERGTYYVKVLDPSQGSVRRIPYAIVMFRNMHKHLGDMPIERFDKSRYTVE